MGSYYVHTRTESVDLKYSYRCEQCGQESGPRKVTVTGEAEERNYRKQLNDAEEDKVREKAHKNLVKKMKEIHQSVTEKQIIPTDFPDECPHCHKPQSWAVAGLKKKMFENPIVCVCVGIFFSLAALLIRDDVDYLTTPVIIGIAAAGVVAGLGCLLWNIIKINSKVNKTSTGMQGGLPVIDWESVQYLLDEN
ncbi:MAG: hypothetical protein K2K63_01710 [Acetatifactor sp.]|nr:hypothetical protein [Acetatifactor sp.]